MSLNNMIYIASDHAGVDLKALLIQHIRNAGHCVTDKGPHTTDAVDYPDYAQKVTAQLLAEPSACGILICGTGIGMSIAANRFPHIRAALCQTEKEAQLARAHNDANVLCLGARIITADAAMLCVDTFLATKFEGGKHGARVQKLNPLDAQDDAPETLIVPEKLTVLDRATVLEKLNVLDRATVLEKLNVLDRATVLDGLDVLDRATVLNRLIALEKDAVSFGFDWPNQAMIFDQIISECAEIQDAVQKGESPARIQEEISDLLHAVISLCMYSGCDVHDTISLILQKFSDRMTALKAVAQDHGLKTLHGKSFTFILELWSEAKKRSQ